MGIFDSIASGLNDILYEPSIEDGVEGTAQVIAASMYTGEGLYHNCHLELVVKAPGVPATAASVDSLVHRNHWPQPGMTLPVLIERSNPKEVVVLWNKVPDARQQAAAMAETIAAAKRSGTAPAGATVRVIGDASAISPEAKEKLLGLGIDIDKLIAGG